MDSERKAKGSENKLSFSEMVDLLVKKANEEQLPSPETAKNILQKIMETDCLIIGEMVTIHLQGKSGTIIRSERAEEIINNLYRTYFEK